MANALSQVDARRAEDSLPFSIPLELNVVDRDTIRALEQYPEGPERDQFALEALKIGVLSLRHASGTIDADLIRHETTRLLDSMREQLDGHARLAHGKLTNSLKEYFDPTDGRFTERVQRLTADDGDLARLLGKLLDGDDSRLAKTLLTHVGKESPLMRLLSPNESEGLLAALRTNVEGQLAQQRERLLKEFSLDNPEGALKRLVAELTAKHGDLSKDLQGRIDGVVKEFSLDKEDSALSRLMRNVDRAQRTITDEFSLDNKASALARLKEEMLTILSAHVKTNAEFQEEVKVALGKLVTKRETEARSTQHGGTFEDATLAFMQHEAQRRGDIAEDTGERVGLIKNCKVGDCVVEFGPESLAPGAKIVVEAKEDAGYSLAKAREEIEVARKNRGADWGLFVFSTKTAPAGLEPFQRFGQDLILVWDAEDTTTDVYLKAGLDAARALCFRASCEAEAVKVDFEGIDRAILDIEKRAGNLDEVKKYAETIQSSSEKILKRVRIDRDGLEKQVSTLREKMGELKSMLHSSEPDA